MISDFPYKPARYFITTFAITFLLWFAGAYFSYQEGNQWYYLVLMLPGLMTPFGVSLWMIFSSGNLELRKDFYRRLVDPRLIRLETLPALLFLMPIAVVVSIAISLPFGGSFEQFRFAEEFSFSAGSLPVLLLLLLAATFEELGWRGYAFDSLQSRFNLFWATLIFSVLWSLWHFPLVFVKDSYQYEVFHADILYGINFFVSIIPMGVIITWFCIKNRKSVLAAILFHFLVNISQEALSMTQLTKCIESFVLTGIAIFLIVGDRELFFSKDHLNHRTRSGADE
jgi:hypothetical protein